MAVQVGSPAAAFKAQAYFRQADPFREVALDDYKGHWLCLYFYELSFSELCGTEVAAFDGAINQFEERGCRLLACSTDSPLVHRAWCQGDSRLAGLNHPILSDMTKRVSMDYGVLLPERGVALRGTFLIDPHQTVRWIAMNDLAVGRSVDAILGELDAIQRAGVGLT